MSCKFRFLYGTTYENLQDMKFHSHNSYELVYYVRGSGKTIIDGCSYKYSEGSFSITLPNNLHNETHEEKTEVLYINFECSNLPIEITNGIYYDAYSKPIYRLLESMKKEVNQKKLLHDYKLELLVQEVLIEYCRISVHKMVSKYENNKTQWLDSVVNFISENYCNEINVEILAKISGYSLHRFRHLFKERTGISPAMFILNQKIKHSKEMLILTNFSITEIANNCGFSNSSQFSISFKRHFGITPSAYRNSKCIESDLNCSQCMVVYR